MSYRWPLQMLLVPLQQPSRVSLTARNDTGQNARVGFPFTFRGREYAVERASGCEGCAGLQAASLCDALPCVSPTGNSLIFKEKT